MSKTWSCPFTDKKTKTPRDQWPQIIVATWQRQDKPEAVRLRSLCSKAVWYIISLKMSIHTQHMAGLIKHSNT